MAGAALAAVGVSVGLLPAQNCNPLEYTPPAENAIIAALFVGSIFWIGGTITLFVSEFALRARLTLAVIALIECGAGVGLAVIYRHRTALYGICG